MRYLVMVVLVCIIGCGGDASEHADLLADTDIEQTDASQGDVEDADEQPGPVVLGFDAESLSSKCRESMVMAHQGAFHRFFEADVVGRTEQPVEFEINHMDVGSKIAKPGVTTLLASPEVAIMIDLDAFRGEFAGLGEEQELTIYQPGKTGQAWEALASRIIKGTASKTSNVDVVFFDGLLDAQNRTLAEGKYAFGAVGSGSFKIYGMLTYSAWHIDRGCV